MRGAIAVHVSVARARSRYGPRRLRLRDGRAVTLRDVAEADAKEILQAFERLSAQSRYSRFLQHRKEIYAGELQRGVHPRPGIDFVLVATVPASDGIDIVGAAQYVGVSADPKTCEFAVTIAEDWRCNGLATALLSRLVRRARRDGYQAIEGWVLSTNAPMLAVARQLDFVVDHTAGEAGVVCLRKGLRGARSDRAKPTGRPVTSS
ncbi:MAG: GNAT family protein [Burkholderiaceae bacterium]|jgi:RimJ/RimL family protein N-acetyltransferase|nr:GNAT family protein [Burkholderiaceae bacterium]